jgi:chromosome segregation ATPase
MGLYDGKGALDITAKTQAAYALILKDTNLAQGDFSRTSEGFANQMRILQASLSDAATEVGLVLLPYFKEFVNFINDNIVPAITAFAENLDEKGLGRSFEFAIAAMGDFGIQAIAVMKSAYIATLEFARSLADILEKLGQVGIIASALSGNVTGAFKSAAVGITASNIGDRIDEQLAGADQLFLDLANGVRTARLELDALKFASNRTTEQQVRNAERVGKVIRTGIKEEEDKDKATTGAAKAVETAKQKLEKYTDAMRSSTKASKAFTDAQKDSKRANEAKAQADADLATAQARLVQVTAGFGADSPEAKAAALALDKAQRGVERAGYRIEQATFAVKDAELELAKVRKDPESSPQAIREAEIALAEAKLALKDATDDQTDATGELKDQQQLLNEAVSGATDGSKAYEEALLAVNDAKKKQEEAIDRVADAIDREAEAQERLNDAIAKQGELAKLYPKIAANNPMAPFAGSVPSTVTGNAGGATFADNPGQVNISVNAGLVSSPDQVAQEIQDILNRRARNNGGNPFTGTFG